MKYQVFDCNKPADYLHNNVDCSWDKSIYDTFEEAQKYCKNWLGQFGALAPKSPDEPVDYCMGSIIEIRTIKENKSP